MGYEDADLGMQSIVAAGFFKAVDVREIPGYDFFRGVSGDGEGHGWWVVGIV